MNKVAENLTRYRFGELRIYSQSLLKEAQVDQLRALIAQSSVLRPNRNLNTLGGRVPLVQGNLDSIGSVMVKSYRRGGLLKDFLSTTHLRVFETRSRREYKILEQVRSFGGNAPSPVAYIENGQFFYNAWLATEEIHGGVNMIEYVNQNPNQAHRVISLLSEQIRILIINGIHHIDLHPGNVVIASDGSAWIVDYDKAYKHTASKNQLRDSYLRRWRRAIIKHGLPEVFCEVVALALRENFE